MWGKQYRAKTTESKKRKHLTWALSYYIMSVGCIKAHPVCRTKFVCELFEHDSLHALSPLKMCNHILNSMLKMPLALFATGIKNTWHIVFLSRRAIHQQVCGDFCCTSDPTFIVTGLRSSDFSGQCFITLTEQVTQSSRNCLHQSSWSITCYCALCGHKAEKATSESGQLLFFVFFLLSF